MSALRNGLCPYFILDNGLELPNTFANRAVWALWMLRTQPDAAEVDGDGLVWFENEADGLYYSVAGNYSGMSPGEKIVRAAQREIEQEQHITTAKWYYENVLYQSKIRKIVLERDENTCQICGCVKDSKLHVHHILKRVQGGTDHLDNLLTVCSGCHKRADHGLYDPDWLNPREELE